jgi:hypothetical protein
MTPLRQFKGVPLEIVCKAEKKQLERARPVQVKVVTGDELKGDLS